MAVRKRVVGMGGRGRCCRILKTGKMHFMSLSQRFAPSVSLLNDSSKKLSVLKSEEIPRVEFLLYFFKQLSDSGREKMYMFVKMINET